MNNNLPASISDMAVYNTVTLFTETIVLSFQSDRVASTSTLLALLFPVSSGSGSCGKLLVAEPHTVQLRHGDVLLLVSVGVGRLCLQKNS